MWFQKAFSEGWDMTTSARQSWWAQSAPGDTSFLLWGCSLQGSDHTSHTPCRRCTSSSWWRSFGLDQLLRSQLGGRSSRSLKMTKSAARKVTFGQHLNFAIGMIDMMRPCYRRTCWCCDDLMQKVCFLTPWQRLRASEGDYFPWLKVCRIQTNFNQVLRSPGIFSQWIQAPFKSIKRNLSQDCTSCFF